MTEPNEFFSTPEISAHLDLIRHLIENSELVPLVRGASGSGKSLLASKLQQGAPDDWVVCHFSAEPTLQPERLLAFIARCNGLPDIAGDLLQRLVARFEVMRKRGRIPVVLVDDAQMLPPTSLMTLLRLFERQLDGVRLVSIVLFANEQIDHLLATPQLQVMSPQAIQAIDMPVLTPRQAVDFMHFVLRGEGLSEHFALDDAKLARVYKETGGVPGPLASEILNDVGRKGDTQTSIFTTYRQQLIMYGAPLLVVVVLLLLFQGAINSMFEPEETVARQPPIPAVVAEVTPGEPIRLPLPAEQDTRIAALPVEKPLQPPVTKMVPKSSLSEPVAPVPVKPVSESAAEQVKESGPATRGITELESPAEPETNSVVGDVESKMPVAAEVTSDGTSEPAEAEAGQAEDRIAEPVATIEPVLEQKTGIVAEPVVIEKPVAVEPPAPSVAKTTPSIPPAAAEAPLTPAAAAENTPETAPVQAPIPVSTVAGTLQDEAQDWIAAQAAENYTLQLIAVENVESLQRFIRANGLQGQVHTHKTLRKGVPWYSLLWGSFGSREQALEAQNQLPLAVQKAGVWARSFGSLQ
ncbi:MAG: AAA family ATPase [Candidatus Thiodiazotropha sp.]